MLFVIDGLGTGGAQRSLAESLPYLAAEGVRPLLACFAPKNEGVQAQVMEDGYDVRFLRGRTALGKLRDLRRIVVAERPDVVHTALFNSDIAGRLAALGSGAKVVTSLVNCEYGEERLADRKVNRLKFRAVVLLESITARHLTDHFHAVSAPVKDHASKALGIPPDRITVVERTRDPARLGRASPERRRAVRSLLGLGYEDRVVVNVGRQEYSKGQRHLIEAFNRLAVDDERLVLLVAGRGGNSSAELEELRQRSPAPDRIHFLGHREDVADILAGSDVFALPSLYEGYPGAMLEAMALGLPVVASDIPSVRQPFGPCECAVLVPAEDAAALARALKGLLDDPEHARALGDRGLEAFRSRLGVEATTAAMVAVYRTVGSEGRRRPPAATGHRSPG